MLAHQICGEAEKYRKIRWHPDARRRLSRTWTPLHYALIACCVQDVLDIPRYEKQDINVTSPHRLDAILNGTRKGLERRFGLSARLSTGLGVELRVWLSVGLIGLRLGLYTATATTAAVAITPTENLIADKLGDVRDEALVVARSKRE